MTDWVPPRSWGITVGELRAALAEFPDALPVMILDGRNGGGMARAINFGPLIPVQYDNLDEGRHEYEGNPDDDFGPTIVLMGYGRY